MNRFVFKSIFIKIYIYHFLITTGGGLFAECLLHSAKAALHSAKSLPSVTLGKEPPSNPLPVKAALPSAKFRALVKDLTPSAEDRRNLFFLKKTLCRVPQLRHSAKKSVFLTSLPSATAPALGKGCFLFIF